MVEMNPEIVGVTITEGTIQEIKYNYDWVKDRSEAFSTNGNCRILFPKIVDSLVVFDEEFVFNVYDVSAAEKLALEALGGTNDVQIILNADVGGQYTYTCTCSTFAYEADEQGQIIDTVELTLKVISKEIIPLIPEDPVLYLKLDDDEANSTLEDETGNYDGVLWESSGSTEVNTNTASESGHINKCINFSGYLYGKITGSDDLRPLVFTFSTWFYCTAYNTKAYLNPIIIGMNSIASWSLYENDVSHTASFAIRNNLGGINYISFPFNILTWYSVIATYDGTSLRVYLDNVLLGTSNCVYAWSTLQDIILADGQHKLDDTRLYNYVVSDLQRGGLANE